MRTDINLPSQRLRPEPRMGSTLRKGALLCFLLTAQACIEDFDGLTGGLTPAEIGGGGAFDASALDATDDGDIEGAINAADTGREAPSEQDGNLDASVTTDVDVGIDSDAHVGSDAVEGPTDAGAVEGGGVPSDAQADGRSLFCSARQCGSDPGSDQSCGTCSGDTTCNALGFCGLWCVPSATQCTQDGSAYRVCGYDPHAEPGKGTYGSAVPCAAGETCANGLCSRTQCAQGEVVFLLDSSSGALATGVRSWAAPVLVEEAKLREEKTLLGLRRFPGETACSSGADLAVALTNASAIEAALASSQAPQAALSIAAALGNLAPRFGAPNDVQAAVLLAAGDPTCDTREEAIQAASLLWRSGIRLHVVALATNVDRAFLDELARVGGTTACRTATDDVALATTLDSIFAELGACDCTPEREICLGNAHYACGADGRWTAPTTCETVLQFSPAPVAKVFAGAVWPSFGVRASNSAGDPVAAQISLALGSSGDSLLGTTTRATTQALATFDDIWTARAGSFQMSASAAGAAGAALSFDVDVSGAKQVATGWWHTCAVLNSNQVKCWGENTAGQLGLENRSTRGDSAGEMGSNLPVANLGTGRTAIHVTVGGYHTCALLDDHSVKCWGSNSTGSLGVGEMANRGDDAGEMGDNLPTVNLGTGRTALTVEATASHTCAILDDQSVKCWGDNVYGQLGLGDTNDRGASANEMGDNLPTVNLGTGRTALAVAPGGNHTCALLDDHSVKCWGFNSGGQLGLGDSQTRGDNPGEMGDDLPAVDLGTGHSALAIAAGANHNCALLDDHTVKCWGSNRNGELGLGDTLNRGDDPGEMGNNLPPLDLGPDRTALTVVTGGSHACAILDDHALKCWGLNGFGLLGLGDTTNRGSSAGQMGASLPAVSLGSHCPVAGVAACGHTCVYCEGGAVKCWGRNSSGQLGLGSRSDYGDSPTEIGDNLPFVDIGPAW